MPPEMRRPPPVDVSTWVEELDRHLSEHVTPRRRARMSRPDIADRWMRTARSLSRPIVHGCITIVAALLIGTALIPPMSESPPSGTLEAVQVVDAPARAQSGVTPARHSLPPPLEGLLPPDDARAVTASLDIQSAREELTGTSHGKARAATTPDGGGMAAATLRPTVR